MRLTLYAKAGCHLCEVAHGVVDEVLRAHPQLAARLEVVDITTDSALMQRFRHDIPVLALDGVPLFRHRVDPARLVDRLLHRRPAPLEEPETPTGR